MSLSIVVLAGGAGTRMNSESPKVLMNLAGKTLLDHVLDAVEPLQADQLIVTCGHKGEVLRQAMSHRDVQWVEQKERLGTGHAVMQAVPHINPDNQVLILYGDIPLLTSDTLMHFVKNTHPGRLGLLTAIVDNPFGLGRILRNAYRQVVGIVEECDATDIQRQIKEINAGVYCISAKLLQKWLPHIECHNKQGEYYLTDIVKFVEKEQISIGVSRPKAVEEIYGANNRIELAKLERVYQKWQTDALMMNGMSMIDPARVDIRGHITAGIDIIVDVNVVFWGEIDIADNCHIGPNCIIKNARLEKDVVVKANSVIDGAVIKAGAHIGPFARIRPDTIIEPGAKIGNFVEIKKSTIGAKSKINHLSYIGDSKLGKSVNIGAGTITCNYDGVNKHKTVIEDNVFIGSNVELVAPINVGKGATVGAGTTVTNTVPEGELVVGRVKQEVIHGWKRPKSKNKK